MNALHCQIEQIAAYLLREPLPTEAVQFYADRLAEISKRLAREASRRRVAESINKRLRGRK